jgi:hypothetical protein
MRMSVTEWSHVKREERPNFLGWFFSQKKLLCIELDKILVGLLPNFWGHFSGTSFFSHLNPILRSWVKIYNSPRKLSSAFWIKKSHRVLWKNVLACYNNCVAHCCKFRSRRIGYRAQSYDRELQRQRCKNLDQYICVLKAEIFSFTMKNQYICVLKANIFYFTMKNTTHSLRWKFRSRSIGLWLGCMQLMSRAYK